MIIKSLEDLQVYQKALQAADAVSAILERPSFRRDPELRNQLGDCAHYQRVARDSCNEMCTHLRVARGRRYITTEEGSGPSERYVVIGKMLMRWIQQLVKDDRRVRS